MFHVGQKVVAIGKHSDGDRRSVHPLPVIGTVYTISNIYVAFDGDTMLELFELPAPMEEAFLPGFVARKFRPVVENKRETDISCFTKIPDQASTKEPA